jgi:hypothetical protein
MVRQVLRYFQVLSFFLFCRELLEEDYVLNVIFIMEIYPSSHEGSFFSISLAQARGMQLPLFAWS